MHFYVICYCKLEPLIYMGHLDFMNLWQLVMRRANVPIAYSEGYNPQMKLNFVQPLSLGMTGKNECLHIALKEDCDAIDIYNKIKETLPEGLKLFKVVKTKFNAKWFNKHKSSIVYKIECNKKITSKELSFIQENQFCLKCYLAEKQIIFIELLNTNQKQVKIKDILLSSFDVSKISRMGVRFKI